MTTWLAAIALNIMGPPVWMPPQVRVDLVFEGQSMARPVSAAALEEVTRIWAASGADVRSIQPDEAGREGAVRLAVVLGDRHAGSAAAEPLGSIRFADGVPEPRIVAYLDAITRFVSGASMEGHPYQEWPLALREVTLGRALGRVLAHEIGHFLLSSPNHSAKGLMRSGQILPDLVSADWHRFVLSAEQTAR